MIVGRLRMYLKFLGTTVSSVSGCSPFSGASLCLRKKKYNFINDLVNCYGKY